MNDEKKPGSQALEELFSGGGLVNNDTLIDMPIAPPQPVNPAEPAPAEHDGE